MSLFFQFSLGATDTPVRCLTVVSRTRNQASAGTYVSCWKPILFQTSEVPVPAIFRGSSVGTWRRTGLPSCAEMERLNHCQQPVASGGMNGIKGRPSRGFSSQAWCSHSHFFDSWLVHYLSSILTDTRHTLYDLYDPFKPFSFFDPSILRSFKSSQCVLHC